MKILPPWIKFSGTKGISTQKKIDGIEEGMRNLPDCTLKHLGKRFEKVSLTKKRKNSNKKSCKS
jgi:hypothetical protein